jgi:Alpha/beta hydrolase domain containing 18
MQVHRPVGAQADAEAPLATSGHGLAASATLQEALGGGAFGHTVHELLVAEIKWQLLPAAAHGAFMVCMHVSCRSIPSRSAVLAGEPALGAPLSVGRRDRAEEPMRAPSPAPVEALEQAAAASPGTAAPGSDDVDVPPVATYRAALLESMQMTVGAVSATLRLQAAQAANRGVQAPPTPPAQRGSPLQRGNRDTVCARDGSASSHISAKALLALTLEAYTDLCRYPRCACMHAGVGEAPGRLRVVHACRPQAAEAAVLVAARHDEYVSAQAVAAVRRHWRSAELWHTSGGHVSSFVLLNPTFVSAVHHSLAKLDAWHSARGGVQLPRMPPSVALATGPRS